MHYQTGPGGRRLAPLPRRGPRPAMSLPRWWFRSAGATGVTPAVPGATAEVGATTTRRPFPIVGHRRLPAVLA
jgi:hypothetical protein